MLLKGISTRTHIKKNISKQRVIVTVLISRKVLIYIYIYIRIYVCGWSVTQSCLFVTDWTVARQAPLSMGFSRQEHWSGLLCPSPGDLPNQGIKPGLPVLHADSSPSEIPGKPHMCPCIRAYLCVYIYVYVYMYVCVYIYIYAQSCPTLYKPMSCSPPGSSVHGILHAQILEWVAIPFSRESGSLLVRQILYH